MVNGDSVQTNISRELTKKMDLANNKWRIWLRRNGEIHEETWWNMWMWLHISAFEPLWKPSVTPYVVSFWVRQSFRHDYARRVFPYAKQIEETLTRSPCGLTQVRVLLTPNPLWQGPYWKCKDCKGRFLERLICGLIWGKINGKRALWTMKHGGLIFFTLYNCWKHGLLSWQSEHIGTKRRKDITNMATKNQG